jgi:adenosylcobinamide-GDP ribazoletransferase
MALDGLRLATGTLTVIPSGPIPEIDQPLAARAMIVAPLAVLPLAVSAALVAWLAGAAGMPELIVGLLVVGTLALGSRGMHLDGLADTVDALGSYRRGTDALAVMKAPDIGPFGVAAVVLTLLIQVAALTALPPFAVVVAWAAGRMAVPVACRRGVPAARSEGLGALVAGTVPVPVLTGAVVAVAAVGTLATPGRIWQGPAAVLAAVLIAMLVVRHCVRRFGGVTGDVIGAAVEVATTTALVVLTLG